MSLSSQALTQVLRAAEESEHHVNQVLTWGIGALTLFILFGMLLALIAFGNGREHS